MSRNAALVTGAGLSKRMGPGIKKEYRRLDGVPVLARSMAVFQNTGLFAEMAVTVPPGQVGQARDLVAPFVDTGKIRFVEGGLTRRDSVFLGLSALQGLDIEYVLIHDAARPWITPELIRLVLEKTIERGAVIPVVDVTDALVKTTPDGRVGTHMAKNGLRGAQTPQGFAYQEIFQAHQAARRGGGEFYDDAQVLLAAGGSVFTVPGDPANRKITYTHDLEDL